MTHPPTAPTFGRQLNSTEQAQCRQAVQQALQQLGKKNLALILHGPSFPSAPRHDSGIGSPNGSGGKALFDFLQHWGFNGIQLGPSGKTKSVDASPYVSTVFSNNPLLIDLDSLVQAGLLNQKTLDTIVQNNPNPETPGKPHRMAYDYVYQAYEAAFTEAHQTFLKKATTQEQAAFQQYKTDNAQWLEKDALYEALATLHGNDYWPHWPNELDQRLLNPKAGETTAAQERIQEIQTTQADVFDRYCWVQWIAQQQIEATKANANQHGIQLIADRQVGFSDRDVWAYQSLFLDGFYLGAPPDYFSGQGQAWGFPVLDPHQIYNQDGTLGKAGLFLKAIFDKTFSENPGGVRIDHIIGLIDPWVYPRSKNPQPENGAGRLYSSPEHPKLNPFSRVGPEHLNHAVGPAHDDRIQHITDSQMQSYGEIIRLILQSAQEQGIPLASIICEDLGTLTNPVRAIMTQMGLSGIRVTEFVEPQNNTHLYRGKNVEAKHWIMAGSHDNMPLLRWVANLWKDNQVNPHAEQLRQDLMPPGSVNETQHGFFDSLFSDPKALLSAKLAELFSSPAENIQLFFTDLFGIDYFYNRPGGGGKNNWTLRLPNAFEAFYHQQLKTGDALNIPEALKLALGARWQQPMSDEQQQLLNQLDHFAQILKVS